ncbi:DUF4838 domain-containing protein [Paenibacillus eucommiae]|uniref:DUF4838 domain-containing protein n=1 Tax=Paenibacillus eucommiae TaxID=1355755 RepID=A0ABS4IRK4_9BACL|nr:DUF4838 domain-containing protein [Paenibacillus eucommiae]MBP1990188.1 hypothetical protein [Paenibacillus eucommiae]
MLTMNPSVLRVVRLLSLILFLVGVLVASLSTSVSASTPVTITSGGVGHYNIVLADTANLVEETAANELQLYIQKVTGVTLPIVGESSAQDKSFMVGPTAFAIANGINPSGEEAWAIHSVGNKIILTGGSTRGTLYAVYHLLEDEIGVRWWNHWEEYVPSKPTLTLELPVDFSGEPAFKYREIFDATDFTGEIQPYSLFPFRNRLNGHSTNDRNTPAAYGGIVSYGPPSHVHTFNRIMPPEEYFDDHPEYYAFIDGENKRDGQLCLANPDVRTIFKQKIKGYIAASYVDADLKGLPRPTMFSVTPNDTEGFCEYPADLAQRSAYGDSGYLLNFVNDIAADIALTYPEVKIDTLAYWYYVDPPLGGMTPASNVQIRYANVGLDLLHPLSHANNADVRSKLEAWKSITSGDLIFWNYAVNYAPNPPLPTMYNKKQDYQYLRTKGVTGIFEEQEGSNHSDMWDMKVWIEAKLMENPDLDLSSLMTDFTDKYYGAAGTYIRQYLAASKILADTTANKVTFAAENNVYNYFSLAHVNSQELILNSAAAAVAGDPVKLQRVNTARASLDRLILFRWNDLYAESLESGVPMNFQRQISSARLLDTLTKQKELRRLVAGGIEQDYNSKVTDEEITKLLIPESLRTIPYNRMVDITSDQFDLYNAYGGVSHTAEDGYLPGIRVLLPDITNTVSRNLHKLPIDIGLYNPVDGTRLLKSLGIADITPDEYQLYKLDDAPVKQNDYLYLFRSWSVKVNFGSFLQGKPAQTYDVYVSMNFKGPSFGGSSSDPDSVYINRFYLVGNTDNITVEIPTENFNLANDDGGLTKDTARTSLLGHAAKIELASMSDTTFRNQHKPLIDIGLYNSTDGTRLLRQLNVSDIVPNQYQVYKIDNALIKPGDYLYLFRSWSVKVHFSSLLQGRPAQNYDVYISMKFEGSSYGGSSSDPDAVYIDRIILVKSSQKLEAESLTVTAITPGVSHTVTSDSHMSGGYGDKLNAYTVNDYMEYSVPFNEPGIYNLKIRVNKSTDSGTFQLSVDGTDRGALVDTYSPVEAYAEYDLGNVAVTSAGNKLFRFKMSGKHAASTGYKLFTDYLILTKQ